MDDDRQVGREPVELAAPVPEHGRRADDQRRSLRAVAPVQQVGDQLHGLAEAHVVGQQRAQAQLAHAHQPAQPDALVGAEHAVEPFLGVVPLAHRLVPHLGCQPLQLGVGLLVHLHRESAHLGGARQRRAERGQRGDARAMQGELRELACAAQRRRAEHLPLAADPHQRLGGGGQRPELVGRDRRAAERRRQVVTDNAVERQRPPLERHHRRIELKVGLLGQRRRQRDRRAGVGQRCRGAAQRRHLVQRQQHQSGAHARERREDVRGPGQRGQIGRPDVQRPQRVGIRRQLELQLQLRESVAQRHGRRDRAQVGRDHAQRGLEHRQVDRVGVAVGRAQHLGLADGGGQRPQRGADELVQRGLRGQRLRLVEGLQQRRVGQRRERRREARQVRRLAAVVRDTLHQPRRQPPRPYRAALVAAVLSQQVGERREHRQAPRLDLARRRSDADPQRQPAQRVGQPGAIQQVGPAARRQRAHGVEPHQRLLGSPRHEGQLERRPPGGGCRRKGQTLKPSGGSSISRPVHPVLGCRPVQVRVDINGERHERDVPGELTLASLLRDDLGLTGTKVACGEGTCGSCTVLVDGHAVLSCLTLVAAIDGAEVRTVESDGELLTAAAAGVHGQRRLPVRLLHARPADVRAGAAGDDAVAVARADRRRDERQPLPLRCVRRHRRRRHGGGRVSPRLIKTEAVVEGRVEERWTLVEDDATPEYDDANPPAVIGTPTPRVTAKDPARRQRPLHVGHASSRRSSRPPSCAAPTPTRS